VTDIPAILKVDTIDNPKHVVNVFRSKAVGEPPLMLGISVWLAIKNALSHLRPGTIPKLSIPATSEAVLRSITVMLENPSEAK
jgi:xanthine dehydrogenase large subunit